jgi:hypothetical protein
MAELFSRRQEAHRRPRGGLIVSADSATVR